MSSSNANVRIGCPACDETVRADVPRLGGISEATPDDSYRLQGTETNCGNCGYEFEFYFY